MAAMYMTETDHQVASMVHCGVTATQDGRLQRLRAPGLCARLLLCLSAGWWCDWIFPRSRTEAHGHFTRCSCFLCFAGVSLSTLQMLASGSPCSESPPCSSSFQHDAQQVVFTPFACICLRALRALLPCDWLVCY